MNSKILIADDEPNILIYSLAKTPARAEQFKWVGEIMALDYYLYGAIDSEVNAQTSLEKLKQYKIGTVRDSAVYQYLIKNDFKKLFKFQNYAIKENREFFNLKLVGEIYNLCNGIVFESVSQSDFFNKINHAKGNESVSLNSFRDRKRSKKSRAKKAYSRIFR